MARRDPGRPKAAHIPDEGYIRSVLRFRAGRSDHPENVWRKRGFPLKVVCEKARKIRSRGFVTADLHVTKAGLEFLALQERAS